MATQATKLRVLAKASTSALVFAESAKRAALSNAEVFRNEVANDALILKNDLREVEALFREEDRAVEDAANQNAEGRARALAIEADRLRAAGRVREAELFEAKRAEINRELDRRAERAKLEDVCGKFDGVCVRPRGHKGGCSNPAPEDSANIPCRCGVDVRSCRKGCRLWACCGGYVSEGHMTDCPGASSVIVEGAR